MANQGDKFRVVKPDMSPYLFHFTKGDNPLETLKKILMEQRLISTLHPYISFYCFTCYSVTPIFPNDGECNGQADVCSFWNRF